MTIMGIDSLVEARIERAIERGELDNLPGHGRPLALDDDSCVAPELRLAYRILKNAGFVPEEIELRREIMGLAVLIDATEGAEQTRAIARRDWLRARLALRGGIATSLLEHQEYAERVARRFERPPAKPGDAGGYPENQSGATPITACRRWSGTSAPETG